MKLFTLLLIFLSISWGYSQNFVSISDGNASTCNGTLFDTGGQGGTGYSDNENFTLTICPDNPNDVVSLSFINFALSTVNTAAAPNNNADNLTIYDGDNTNATSLGTYTGNQLQGLTVSCTSLNTTGCLTLVWESNDQGTGVFAASISCTTPCDRPTVSMVSPTVPQNPQRICIGDGVTFDGSASFAAPGFNIVEYIWNWGDGEIDTTTIPTATHDFTTGAGEYPVNLYVIDDNGCINSNLETINVQVGTEPDLSFISGDTTLCIGESACLEAFPDLMPITWTELPSSNLGGATYLPDDVGSCFQSELVFNMFTPGQTLNNTNDLLDICVSMEHSFMGDLVATIICPNGQSVILHQQNGGGTFLGDPFDVDDSLQPGNCWSYCWSPTATNGTWVDNAEFGPTPNVTIAPNTGFNSLTPGTYESLNSLGGLVGCPLNGTWTIEFCDLWGSDDGFICDWSLSFDPSIYPPLTTFTPVIGTASDSSAWSATGTANSFITSSTSDLNEICVTPTQAGVFGYDYSVIDNHGCTYDTTIFVTVGNGPTIFAGNDTTVCPGDLQIDAITTGGIGGPNSCDYTINMFDTFGDGWNGFSVDVYINGQLDDNHTMSTGANGTSTFSIIQGDQISISTTSGIFDTEVSYEILDCAGNVVIQDGVNYTGNAPTIGNSFWNGAAVSNAPSQYSYSWTPTAGVVLPNQEDPLITVTATQTYAVDVWETDHPDCVNSDDITVTIMNMGYAGGDTALFYCLVDPAVDLFTLIPNNPDAGGTWYEVGSNTATTSNFDPAINPSTDFVYVVGGGGCSDSAFVSVTVEQPFVLNLVSDTIICENGIGTLTLNPSGGIAGPYTETWTNGLAGNAPHNVQPGITTCYDVFVTDGYGCVSQTESVCVNYNPPILLTLTDTDSICIGDNANIGVQATGGNSNYTYDWIAEGVSISTDPLETVSPIVTTDYCVTVSDGCETTPVTECVEIAIFDLPTLSFESDVASGCYPLDVTFTNTTTGNLVQSIDWHLGDGTTQSGLGPIQHTYTSPTCFDVNITATTINGCVLSLDQLSMICPDDYPVANFTFDPNPTNLNQTTISFTELASSDATSFLWEFGDSSQITPSTETDPVVTYPAINPGNYDITLTVENAAGCAHDTTFTLIINGVFSFYVPNTFTPNGDGINDVFFPKGEAIDPENYEMIIFDRNGLILYETSDYNAAWDGTKLSEAVPEGVYVWKILVYDYYTGDKKYYRGHINLIR
jgi:gliding motility-associated-like protein